MTNRLSKENVISSPKQIVVVPGLGAPAIQSAERFSGGMIVDFTNGVSAVYTAEMLYSLLGEVKVIT